MFESIGSFFIAFLGLGFLIFIHELGHLFMAKKVGMKVEAFGIGFGKPFFTFVYRGIPINLCPIPFGGYVKIAGMEAKKGEAGPVKDGFFTKNPKARIAVAIAGPGANLLFAFFVFSCMYFMGGRLKPYQEVSSRIGLLEKSSDLYKKGVRPGDRVISYNGKEVLDARDHVYAAMVGGSSLHVVVQKERNGQRMEEAIDAATYQDPRSVEKGVLTAGIVASAGYVVWNPPKETLYQKSSQMAEEQYGIRPGDRIVWADGQNIFSVSQLLSLINEPQVFLTVLRNGTYVQAIIPRVVLGELVLPKDVYGELSDWRYEANLQKVPFKQIWYIPYDITLDGTVSKKLSFFDQAQGKNGVEEIGGDELQPGDRIVSIFGERVDAAPDILKKLQEKKAVLVVERQKEGLSTAESADIDEAFMKPFRSYDFYSLVKTIGTPQAHSQEGEFVAIQPIVLKNKEMVQKLLGKDQKNSLEKEEQSRLLRNIEDPAVRFEVEKHLQTRDRELYLGLFGISDIYVRYNPAPIAMMAHVLDEMYCTIAAVFDGNLSPRWMSGPVGIVQVIQHQVSVGFLEVLYWLGVISLNLALLNLLPLPVLDGGYVCLSLFEMVTGIRIKVETLEKIILPFTLVFIALFVYVTYHDIVRLGMQFLKKWGF